MNDAASEHDRIDSLARARARIARELLASEPAPTLLGAITLHPHQRTAVSRVRSLLRLTNGALIADGTGLGKTFVALAVAAEVKRSLIIAPASLIDAWRLAMARTQVNAAVVSMERLSRSGWRAPFDPELVIVDESHHLRNPRTKRYAAAAVVCDAAKVLLLSATPLQNRRDDLISQLALFLGEGAAVLSDDEVARFIVRRRGEDVALPLPTLRGPHRVELPVSDDLLDRLIALPPPLPGNDEGQAAALVAYTLLRQWASSRAALVSALRRRLAKAIALATSLEAGRWPSRDELTAWSSAGDAVQLALPELLTPPAIGAATELSPMLDAVRAHMDGLRDVLARLRDMPDPDPARAAAIDDICRFHTSARVIVFSQYAETVRALSHLLMSLRTGVAELTARGGRVAGGRISRREVLAQFAPRLANAREPPTAERISLLVTTDVLSEGLDLQGASVLIHLDLPWNPARLEQRVGRVRRLSTEHDAVFVYTIAPPARAEHVLRVEARLRVKLGVASQVVGVDMPIMTGDDPAPIAARPELMSEILAALTRWRIDADAGDEPAAPLYAAVRASHDGLLALVAAGNARILIGALGPAELTADPSVVSRVVAQCEGSTLTIEDGLVRCALDRVGAWCARWSARQRLGFTGKSGARVRATIAGRIVLLLSTTPRHQHAAIATLASRARRTLSLALGAGAERALAALADSDHVDADWLAEIVALAKGRDGASFARVAPYPVVVVLLQRDGRLANESESPGA